MGGSSVWVLPSRLPASTHKAPSHFLSLHLQELLSPDLPPAGPTSGGSGGSALLGTHPSAAHWPVRPSTCPSQSLGPAPERWLPGQAAHSRSSLSPSWGLSLWTLLSSCLSAQPGVSRAGLVWVGLWQDGQSCCARGGPHATCLLTPHKASVTDHRPPGWTHPAVHLMVDPRDASLSRERAFSVLTLSPASP